jgi:hypothetical protein
VSERVARRPLDASLTHGLQIHRTQGRREGLASLGGGKLGVRNPNTTASSSRTSGRRPSRFVTISGPRPVTSASSIDAASPVDSASGW